MGAKFLNNKGFLLSRHWRDTAGGVALNFWLSTKHGPVQLLIEGQQAVFFMPTNEFQAAQLILRRWSNWHCKEGALQDFQMQPVIAYYFQRQRDMREARDALLNAGLSPLESDIKPSDRFLMERFIRGDIKFMSTGPSALNKPYLIEASQIASASDYKPQFKMLSIEVKAAMKELRLYSIAVYALQDGSKIEKIFMLSKQPVARNVEVFSNEKQLLIAFLAWLKAYDPDIIIGWAIANDALWLLANLYNKHKLRFSFGRSGDSPHWRGLDDEDGHRVCSVAGRVIIDSIELLKAAGFSFSSYNLNTVAAEVFNDENILMGQQSIDHIRELFNSDKSALAQHNLNGCKLVWNIVKKLKLIDFAIERSRSTGLPLERIGGSVASFDFRYLPLLHRQGFVAPNGHLSEVAESSPGGLVMDSLPGLYQHVLVLDFKSLYPSIIRSFKIDPMAMAIGLHQNLEQSALVPGFKGAWFAKHQNILPKLIAELWAWRDEAKARDNQPLSQTIKIIMNSFYGVLGSRGCRFFDPRLASSITQRGHQIIQQTAQHIERQTIQGLSCKVIYGDTDSVFVWLQENHSNELAMQVGGELASRLNRWWQQRLVEEYGVESALEIEFETHFQKFLMPTIRGSDQGSKKRYAGVIEHNGKKQLIFKGLETVRTDWTMLAKNFQYQVYKAVFFEQPYRAYVIATLSALRAGEYDSQLIYRKRLRRKLVDYQRNIPPHVQAARKAAAAGAVIHRGDWVEYIITLNGAEPLGGISSAIDYQHYEDKQLAPAVDSILYFVDDSFDKITGQQLSIF